MAGAPLFAEAAILLVDFTPDPLFVAENFLPEDAVSGTVEVSNTDEVAHEVVTEAINVSDDDAFGSTLKLTITDGATTFFSDTFSSFLTSGVPTALGSLSPLETKTYTYTVTFLDTSDNTYQGKKLGFDLCVGFSGGTSQCGDTAVGGEGDTSGGGGGGSGGTIPGSGSSGGGGGGGGPIPSVTLQISNEEATVTNPDIGEALIEWDTNLYATSQVIYGLASGVYVLDLVEPIEPAGSFYGYPLGTVENATKILHHSVTLTGLTPGEAYKYRVVSRASPPTISFERQFTVAAGSAIAIRTGSGSSTGGSSAISPSASSGGNSAQSGSPSLGGGMTRSQRSGSAMAVERESGDQDGFSLASSAQDETAGTEEMAPGIGVDYAKALARSGDSAESESVNATETVARNNLAAVLSGIPLWLREHLSCIVLAALLLSGIYLSSMPIAKRYARRGFDHPRFLYPRKLGFLVSACALVAILALMFNWCLLWPFVSLSLIGLILLSFSPRA